MMEDDYFDDGESFSQAQYRASTNPASELSRWLPSGVRQALTKATPGEDLSHLPKSILDYMKEHEIVAVPEVGSHSGMLILSNLGKQLRRTNIARLEGRD